MSTNTPHITFSFLRGRSPSPDGRSSLSPSLRNRVAALRLEDSMVDAPPMLGLLLRRIREGETELALKLITPDTANFLDQRDSSGRTPLVEASASGDLIIVQALLDAGASPDAMDHNNRTPIYEAARQGKLLVVKALLAAHANPDSKSVTGQSPLHIASREQGMPEIAEALLSAGADPNKMNEQGQMPLHLAAAASNPKMVETLLRGNADASRVDATGRLPVDIAVAAIQTSHPSLLEERFKILEILLQANGNIRKRVVEKKMDNTKVLEEIEPDKAILKATTSGLSSILKTLCDQEKQNLRLIGKVAQQIDVVHPDAPAHSIADNGEEEPKVSKSYLNFRKAVWQFVKRHEQARMGQKTAWHF